MHCQSKPSRNAFIFKLSFFGVMMSFILTILGVISSQPAIQLPLSWAAAVVILLPSLIVYYRVRDAFWAEVTEHAKKKQGPRGA